MPSQAAAVTVDPCMIGMAAQASEAGAVSTKAPVSSEMEDCQADDEDGVLDPSLSIVPVFNMVVYDAMAGSAEESAALRQQQDYKAKANIKALAISAFLFSLITVVQVFAAKAARSQALLMDCISMGVDAFTYMCNILVEWKKRDGGDHMRAQLIVVACSLSCLIYFTADAARGSWGTVQSCRGVATAGGDEDDVNGHITLAFALGGVVFDVMCLAAFYRSNKKTGSARHVNMFSALLHVGADCLRSSSTLVMSVLILGFGYDSTCLDAYTSLFIGFTIIAGASTGLYRWLKLLVRYSGCLPGGIARPATKV